MTRDDEQHEGLQEQKASETSSTRRSGVAVSSSSSRAGKVQDAGQARAKLVSIGGTNTPAASSRASSSRPRVSPVVAEEQRTTRMWEAYREIRRRIIELELSPGAAFTEGELAAELGLSKTPVREALLLLQSDGLVFARPATGYRVSPITLKDARNLCRYRALLEGEAAAIAATRALEGRTSLYLEDVAELRFDPGDDASIDYYLSENTNFHYLIAKSTGNLYLQRQVYRVLVELERLFRFALRLAGRPGEVAHDHHALVDAIVRHDPERARQAAIDHAAASEDMVVEALLSSDVIQGVNVGDALDDQIQA